MFFMGSIRPVYKKAPQTTPPPAKKADSPKAARMPKIARHKNLGSPAAKTQRAQHQNNSYSIVSSLLCRKVPFVLRVVSW